MIETDRIDMPSTVWVPWACEEANVAPDAAAAVVRQEICRRLERDEWVPSSEGQFAIDTLLSRDGEPRPTVIEGSGEFIIAAEKKFASEVDAFAAEFFSLHPDTRASRLAALAQRGRPFPIQLWRLRELQRGVNVVVPRTGGDRAMLDLAEHVAQLFVLMPQERARRRRQPDQRLLQSLPDWRDAARRLWSKYPTVAALQPTLMRSLTTKQVRETSSYRRRTTAPRRRSESGGVFSSLGELFGSLLGHRWAVAIVCMVAVRGCAALSKPSMYTPSRSGGGYYSESPSSYYNGGSNSRPLNPNSGSLPNRSPYAGVPNGPYVPTPGVPNSNNYSRSPNVPGRSSGAPSPGGGRLR